MAEKRNQTWLTLTGRSGDAIKLARDRMGDDLPDAELLKRIVEEWYLHEKGDQITIKRSSLLPGLIEEARSTYEDATSDVHALTRLINGWKIDRLNNSKRGSLRRIEEQIAEMKAMIENSRQRYSDTDRRTYNALLRTRQSIIDGNLDGLVGELNYWISVYEPPGEDA